MTLPIEVTLLGGVVITGVGGFLGHYLGARGKVDNEHCNERRTACNTLVVQKLKNLDTKIDTKFEALEKIVIASFKK